MARTRLAAAGAVVLALLTACSDDGKGGDSADDFTTGEPQAIVDAAQQDMKALETVRINGDMTSDGSEIAIDLGVSTAGDCTGTFGLGEGSAEIVSLDGETWFRPDEAFWRASSPGTADQIISVVGDKWVALGAGDATFDEFCNLDSLLDELFDAPSEEGYTKGETSEVEGEQAIAIEQTEDGDPVIGYIAVDSPHYLLKLEREGTDSGAITFSDFDEELDIEAPAEDEVVDLSQLS